MLPDIYVAGPVQTSCEDISLAPVTQEECERQACTIVGKTWNGTREWPVAPPGCFYWTAGLCRWNEHPTGGFTDSRYGPVCKGTSSCVFACIPCYTFSYHNNVRVFCHFGSVPCPQSFWPAMPQSCFQTQRTLGTVCLPYRQARLVQTPPYLEEQTALHQLVWMEY